MRIPLVVSLCLLSACDPGPESNSSGQLGVTGDQTWGGSLKGLGVKKEAQRTGFTCGVRLFDVLASSIGGSSEYPNDRNATYTFALSIGRSSTGLTALPMGVQMQGDASQGTSTPWPSEVSASFGRYEGAKHNVTQVYTTGGTVTITRFDAQKLVGTFDLTGGGPYCGPDGVPCTLRATGDFDATNVDCVP